MNPTDRGPVDVNKLKETSKWKEKREEKKKEKQLMREEAIRKDRVAPKDSKVKLIDSHLLEKYNLTNKLGRHQKQVKVKNVDQFPQLKIQQPQRKDEGVKMVKSTFVSKLQPLRIHDDNSFPTLGFTNKKNKPDEASSVSQVVEPRLEINIPAVTSEVQRLPVIQISRKKRSNHPIMVPFSPLLKSKQTKRRVLGSKLKKETSVLSGNMLDSDKPKRRKGKVRVGKRKKKLSRLKTIIIIERIVKKFANGEVYKWLTQKDYDINNIKHNEWIKQDINNYLTEINRPDFNKRYRFHSVDDEIIINSCRSKLQQLVNLINSKNSPAEVNTTGVQFSRKFREYCDNLITQELNKWVQGLLELLVKFQDRLHGKDPVKARIKRRYLVGFNETKKYLKLKKVKLVIIAPNLVKCWTPGGIDDVINEIKTECLEQNVVYSFALDRSKLQHLTKKTVPISVVAVLNYEGADEQFHNVVRVTEQLKQEFQVLNGKKAEQEAEQCDNVNTQLITSFISKLSVSDGANTTTRDNNQDDSDEDKSNPFLRAIANCA